MSQDWTRNDVLENSARAVLLINECLANAVEMRIKASQQKAEIEQLKAIVDKLPKTADGVPVVPGMEVWVSKDATVPVSGKMIATPRSVNELAVSYLGRGIKFYVPVRLCFSTREAAEAAKEE